MPVWLLFRIHELKESITVNYSPEMNQWKVTNSSGMSDVLSTETFGTKRLNAYELTELLLNQKRAVVNDYRELPDGRTERVFNAKETILARECQDKIEQASGILTRLSFRSRSLKKCRCHLKDRRRCMMRS